MLLIAAAMARCLMAAGIVLSVSVVAAVVADRLRPGLPAPVQPRDAQDGRNREDRY